MGCSLLSKHSRCCKCVPKSGEQVIGRSVDVWEDCACAGGGGVCRLRDLYGVAAFGVGTL